jgi:hypothetical protein
MADTRDRLIQPCSATRRKSHNGKAEDMIQLLTGQPEWWMIDAEAVRAARGRVGTNSLRRVSVQNRGNLGNRCTSL